MLEIGITGQREITVTNENTAKTVGSGELDVLATPAMIALMEETAYKSVAGFLDAGMGSVGTLMNVKHVSATPLGMKVTCQTELKEVDGRRLVFHVQAHDETGLIGEGVHERFIVENEKFQNKANQKNFQ